jgi:hypothetical protein
LPVANSYRFRYQLHICRWQIATRSMFDIRYSIFVIRYSLFPANLQ